MNRLRAVSLPVVLPGLAGLLLANPALAAGGGDGLMWPWINLILLLGALVYFGRGPIVEMFAGRRTQIQTDIDAASNQLGEAERNHAELQRKLQDLDAELEAIRGTAQQRAGEERDRILADARASAERIRSDAQTAIAQEVARARESLRDEAVDLALELAGERLGREVTDADRARILDEFIGRIESSSGGSTGPGH